MADTVVDAVKQRRPSAVSSLWAAATVRVRAAASFRDFVRQAPDDSIILTLACGGKFRFNDLDLGTIGGLPRIMDMGSATTRTAPSAWPVALAEAFDCGVNDLPLTLVLSWYEQKAVSILG